MPGGTTVIASQLSGSPERLDTALFRGDTPPVRPKSDAGHRLCQARYHQYNRPVAAATVVGYSVGPMHPLPVDRLGELGLRRIERPSPESEAPRLAEEES